VTSSTSQGALPQGGAADRRRRRWRAHPDTGTHTLFREMQPLIEAGYVYIAKPPLYALRQGRHHRLHRTRVRARGHPARRQVREDRSVRSLQQAVQADRHPLEALFKIAQAVRGWASALRSAHGHGIVAFVQEGRLLEEQITDADGLLRHIRTSRRMVTRIGRNWSRRTRSRSCQRRSSARGGSPAPIEYAALRWRPTSISIWRMSTASLRRWPARPVSGPVGRSVQRGLELRRAARNGPGGRQKGVDYVRFKGLGEMDGR